MPRRLSLPRGAQAPSHGRVPAWAVDAIWYQIMVDRFRNGDPTNDPSGSTPWTQLWEEGPHPAHARLYGGDLQGALAGIPYLKSLGVTALYLNPVFASPTHHKYDTLDWRHVDDHFGIPGGWQQALAREDWFDPSTWTWTPTDRLFLEFVRAAHAAGMRVVIDVSFNHVSYDHPAFRDVRENGRASRFADWFEITQWDPVACEGWAGFGRLPVIRKAGAGPASPTLAEHILAVTRRWMNPHGPGDPTDGIDGWRLDVANEIPGPFWQRWRETVKAANPEAIIVGEVWDSAEDWVENGPFDVVMNYEYARAAVEFFADRGTPRHIDAVTFLSQMRALRSRYPLEATRAAWSMHDSHDTDRLVSRIRNPGLPYDQLNTPAINPGYDVSKPTAEDYRRLLLALFIQMAMPGAPIVWQGTEVGMWGADDPHCRKPMLWDDVPGYDNPAENRVEADVLEAFRAIVAFRRAHPVLSRGDLAAVATGAGSDLLAYERTFGSERMLIVANNSPEAVSSLLRLACGTPARAECLFGQGVAELEPCGSVRIALAAWSGSAWRLTD